MRSELRTSLCLALAVHVLAGRIHLAARVPEDEQERPHH